jgi:hypothetical protein
VSTSPPSSRPRPPRRTIGSICYTWTLVANHTVPCQRA